MATTRLGRQVEAPAPSWTRTTSVVVVGAGAAGLSAALPLAAAGIPVTVLARGTLLETATAQSASAAERWHHPASVQELAAAGNQLCEADAARELVVQAPALLRWLDALATRMSTAEQDARLPLGRVIQRTLSAVARVQELTPAGTLRIDTGSRAIDVLTDASGHAAGVRVMRADGSVGTVLARAVVLANGGAAGLWNNRTASAAATGDGMAMALRAGAELRDMEFVQFAATAFEPPAASRLAGETLTALSPELREASCTLVDAVGEPVMAPDASQNASETTIAFALADWLAEHPGASALLDARGMAERVWDARPHAQAAQALREHDFDPAHQVIPVHPAAQAFLGGVAIDASGATTVPGLWAAGEVACSGANGASGPADGLLVDALVTGTAVGRRLAEMHKRTGLDEPGEPADRASRGLLPPTALPEVRRVAEKALGLRRDHEELRTASEFLARLPHEEPLGEKELTGTNLQTIAAAVAVAATARPESRGWHRRIDHPETNPKWARQLRVSLDDDGTLQVAAAPLRSPATAPAEASDPETSNQAS